jgi:type II secretory pathway pseudopilin PulG
VLLEVLVAIALLAISGITMLTLASESLRAVARARMAEQDLTRASALLEAVALWPREDLDRHLGTRPQGSWRMRVERPLPTLYTITLTDSAAGIGVPPLLATALYRLEGAHATP